MKKWSNLSLIAVLLMGLLLYNCKKKEADPLEPNPGLVDEIDKVDLPPLELEEPEPVTFTEATITTSPAVGALAAGLVQVAAGGELPESVVSSVQQVQEALSPTDLETLESLDDASLEAIAEGGELSPAVQALMDKVASDPRLNVLLPSFTLPTVNGQPVSARTGNKNSYQGIQDFLDVAVADECLAKANEAFNNAKAKLDASKTAREQSAKQAYDNAIANLTPNSESCLSDVNGKYVDLISQAAESYRAASSGILAVSNALGSEVTGILMAINQIAYLGHVNTLFNLRSAETQACVQVNTLSSEAAQEAYNANLAKINSDYQDALNQITDLRGELLESCHNQGGGN